MSKIIPRSSFLDNASLMVLARIVGKDRLGIFPNISLPRCFNYHINLEGYHGNFTYVSNLIDIDSSKLKSALTSLKSS